LIFVDTSFWVASAVARDVHHAEANRLLTAVASESLVTSNHVRGETWTFIQRRHDRRYALAFLDKLDRSPRVNVEFVTEAEEDSALEWLRQRDEREYSFVDATSFTLMRSLKIDRALTFDGDFAAAGFIELR
jgi:uncharacterized protein